MDWHTLYRRALFQWKFRKSRVLFLAFVAVMLVGGVFSATRPAPYPVFVASQIISDIKQDRVLSVTIKGDYLEAHLKNGITYAAWDANSLFARQIIDLSTRSDAHVKLAVQSPSQSAFGAIMMQAIMQIVLPIGMTLLLFRMMKSMGLTPVKVTHGNDIRFDDIVGASEAKQGLEDIRAYLANPEAFVRIGARPPRGVLLTGQPGGGKTLLARALAGETGAAFISSSGSDFTSMFMGQGVERVKRLFAAARKNAPCIIFLDEIDGIGARAAGGGSAQSESNRIINQVLVEMDGFDAGAGVIVIGATNAHEQIDPALLREGRFDRRVALQPPGLDDREALFKLYLEKIKHEEGIDTRRCAKLAAGLTPAAIAYTVNHAGILAARKNDEKVRMEHILESLDVSRMGEQVHRNADDHARIAKRLAVHESGHAIVAALTEATKVDRVTILGRGWALGVTLLTSENDTGLQRQSELESAVMVALAGRNAEKIILGDVSTGAADDLDRASQIVYQMVSRLGMSPSGAVFSRKALLREGVEKQDAFEAEARDLLAMLDKRCVELLQRHRSSLEMVAEELIERETIEGAFVLEALGKPALLH